MFEVIEQGKVYTLCNLMVKLSNRRYTSIPNDYCLVLSEDTQVQQCANDPKITRFGFTFVGLAEIEGLPAEQRVDVIGIILEIAEPAQISMRDGTKREKRSLTLADESKVSIDVTIWGPEIFQRYNLQVGQIIAFRCCRISEYYGRTLNASWDTNDICVDMGGHPREQ